MLTRQGFERRRCPIRCVVASDRQWGPQMQRRVRAEHTAEAAPVPRRVRPATDDRLDLQRLVGNRTTVDLLQRYVIYRGGGKGPSNMTPRQKDTEGDKRGLSTFRDLDAVKDHVSEAQMIETTKLAAPLQAWPNGSDANDSHESIVPAVDHNAAPSLGNVDNAVLVDWANKKRTDLTDAVKTAITGTWKKPKT